MAHEPVYFIHGSRVVRGHITRRFPRQHAVMISAENYVYADGEVQPIPLSFTRRINAEEYFMEAAPLLALVSDLPKEEQ